MKNYRNYVKQFIALCVVYSVICGVLTVLLLNNSVSVVWAYLLCIVMGLPVKFISNFFAERNFISVLSDEMDAQKFYDIIYQKPKRFPKIYKIIALWYTGDYQEMITVASAGYRNTKNLRWRRIYLTYLARAYFDIRDYDNLVKTVDAFYALKKDDKTEKLSSRYSFFQYCKAYVNGEYEQCISLSEARAKKLKKTRGGKLQRLSGQSNLAIAYYELGNLDRAKEIFQWFIETTPKLTNFRNLSEKYLEAIEEGHPPLFYEEEIVPDDNYRLLDKKASSRRRVRKTVIFVCVLAFALYGVFLNQSIEKYNKEITVFEMKLQDAISTQYSDAIAVDYFNVEKESEIIDTLCLVEADNKLNLFEIGSYDDNDTFVLFTVADDLEPNTYYCVKIPLSNYYMGFKVSSKEPVLENLYYSSKFTFNKKNYWFYIDYVETTPKF